ncbi:MAG: type VI secretion system contractile sheath large subunit [Rhodothermaceae bacterium]
MLNKYYGSGEKSDDAEASEEGGEEGEGDDKKEEKAEEPQVQVNPYMKTLLEVFFDQYKTNMVLLEYSGKSIEPNHIVKMLLEFVADLNELIGNQINEILHAPEFQKLEASWKALNFLVKKTETGARLKLRLLNITKAELQKDLEKAVEFDQSQLFKKVYEEEYGTFGGHPYGILLGDFMFERTAKDIALLTLVSQVAAAAHAPFISAASPQLFGADSFKVLPEFRDLNAIFESLEMIKWNSFRDSEDSRYVSLTLPRMLMRLPYGPNTLPVEGFDFTEDVDGTDHSKYLWANSAYALVQRITEAYAKYSWCAAIRGVEGGGLVQDLPAHVFDTDSGDKSLKCPTEIAITDRREKELSDLGFISLVHCKGKDYAAFFGGQTTQKPKVYDTPEANANARLSAVLPYIIASSRFAHYLKVIVRDKIGSFLTAENVQVYLNRWIGGYVLGKDDAGQEIKAQYPLREARVDVSDTPGKPGCYTAVVFLKPHFQLEELTTSIRLVAELPPPAA